ncbi:MAG: hypothetical protein ABR974_04650 [Bacteroidales bacterium]|jgi:hypothetical protein
MKTTKIRTEYHYKTWRLLLIGLIAIFFSTEGFSQTITEEKPPIKERLFFGGNIALQVGSATDIEILPVVGFWVLPRLAIAAGPGFRYYSGIINAYSNEKISTSIYSFRSYAQFVPIRDIDKLIPLGVHTSILLQLEYEAMNLDSYDWQYVTLEPHRFWVSSIMAGPGISQQMGRRSSLNIVILWSLHDTGYEIYNSPVIRIGVVF